MRTRLAVIDRDLCRPKKCNYECINVCPINRSGRGVAIEADRASRSQPVVHEDVCIGCGICVKACPFKALAVVNLPSELEEKLVHRYGVNGFKLYGLPIPKDGMVVGVIGKNGTGKSTAARILSGELKPNLGNVNREVDFSEVIKKFKGTELQMYFKLLSEGKIRASYKIQHVDVVPRYVKGTVGELLKRADERGVYKEVAESLGLTKLWDRDVRRLSGGELQKLVIAAVACKDSTLYVFDEPSSFLDVRERMKVAKLIRSLARPGRFVLVVEHDLAVLDYVSDVVHAIYGEPGVYGVISEPYGVREGINAYLDGYLPAENVLIRKEPIKFRLHEAQELKRERTWQTKVVEWSNLEISLNGFSLSVEPGEAYGGEIVGIVGPNGIGKTTFVKTLAGEVKPRAGFISWSSGKEIAISYKPQYVSPESFQESTVLEVLMKSNPESVAPGSWLYLELTKKLGLDKLMDRSPKDLSGGELQKLAVASALAREAEVYLLDEPSAYLDVEERIAVSKVIRRLAELRRSLVFVVEHDVMIADYVSDVIMVFSGEPGIRGIATRPLPVKQGMNSLLKELEVTMRKDPSTGRPRINKEGSYLDRLQKSQGQYYW